MNRSHWRARRQWLALTAGFLVCAALVAVESAFSQDARARGEVRLAELRKDPQRYAKVVEDAKKFFALLPERQAALLKLDEDLQTLNPGERARLLAAMKQYADWLDQLPTEARADIVNAPDKHARLQKVKDQREREWLAHQPKAIREYLAKLPKGKPAPAALAASLFGPLAGPGNTPPLAAATSLVVGSADLRAEMIQRLKHDDSQHARDWIIAARFWQDLAEPDPKKQTKMPNTASHFGAEVDLYVRAYLRPALSKEEQKRLDDAEGKWPQYPVTLVELADKYPMALPHRNGPKKYADLPPDVRKQVDDHWPKLAKKGKNPLPKTKDEFFHSALRMAEVTKRLNKLDIKSEAARFACAVASWSHEPGLTLTFKFELWPSRRSEMGPAMKEFLDAKGSFMASLSSEELKQLGDAENHWPEYPLRIRDLAEKHGFKPPWQSLPEPDPNFSTHRWDNYRIKTHKVRAELLNPDAMPVIAQGNQKPPPFVQRPPGLIVNP